QTKAHKAKAIANWITGEMAHLMKQSDTGFEDIKIDPSTLSNLVTMVHEGVLGTPQARIVFEEMFHSGKTPEEIVEEKDLSQISDLDAVLPTIDLVLLENQQAVSDYQQGKESSIRFLVGQVMRLTAGRANPSVVIELLENRLKK
ncbi:Asp-tRNA(Asn)/Glu-tRNA(Gln) amidotransferase GatCAB subunit B, partial [SAR202 cluster bacterium AD-802-E10_MRT_200m]|nr:Asp-tRNA(Asn)/Glu-tRNA(Gln) amidotransferase GatCAB subunit B [SAR202 cluster bacterium AD-802-E10_MRT_200m]